MGNIFVILTFFFTVLGLNQAIGQTQINGTIKAFDSGAPVPFAKLTIEPSRKVYWTNKEGIFQFYVDTSKDTTLTIAKMGYTDTKTDLRIINDSSLFLITRPIREYDDSSIDGASILRNCLDNIELHYVQDTHTLIGAYTESYYVDQELLAYGEGILHSSKTPYESNPSYGSYFSSNQSEATTLIKGFFSALPSRKYSIPTPPKAAYLPKVYDIFKSASSPLLKENFSDFEFLLQESIIMGKDTIYTIDFQSKRSEDMIFGSFKVLNLRLIKSAEINIMAKENPDLSIKPTLQQYNLIFGQNGDKYFLESIDLNEEFTLMDLQEKTLSININYRTTATFPFLIKPIKNELQSYIPIRQGSFFHEISYLPRSKEAKQSIGTGAEIKFKEGEIENLIEEAQIAGKLLFIFAYDPNDEPCKRVFNTSFKQQELVHLINKSFVAGKIDLTERRHERFIYQAGLQFTPSYIIMTPLGQVIEVDDGFQLPSYLVEKLKGYVGINTFELFSVYDRHKGSSNKKMDAAYANLFLQLDRISNKNASNFLDLYVAQIKKWEHPRTKEILFKYLLDGRSNRFAKIFFQELEYYENRFGNAEVGKRISDLATAEVLKKDIRKPNIFKKFVDDKAPKYSDSLYTHFLVDYFRNIQPDERSFLNSIITLVEKYPSSPWNSFNDALLLAAMVSKDNYTLSKIINYLEENKGKITEHERLDIISVALYNLGEEEKAYRMIEDVMREARKAGIKYRVALSNIKNIIKN